MSTPPEQQKDQHAPEAAAHPLRDLVVRLLVDASISDPRVLQASGLLQQVVNEALTRRDAGLKEKLSRIEQQLASLRQQPPGRNAPDAGREETAQLLQQLRGEVALLSRQVQRLSHNNAAPGGARWRGLWLTTALTLLCVAAGASVLSATYLWTHRPVAQTVPEPDAVHAEPTPLTGRSRTHAGTSSGETPTNPAQARKVPQAVEALTGVPGGPPSRAWQRVWDLAVTQPFSCPGDPGASTLLQCACPEVHPAPPPGYPYEGVGERCPPGAAWNGFLAVAALQAVLKVEDPELQTDIDGMIEHLSPAFDRLAARCSLPRQPDNTAAALQSLILLREHPACLSGRIDRPG